MSEATAAAGGKVWLDMDQAALDRAYDQTNWAPNQDLVHKRREVLAQETYARRKPKRFTYGDRDILGFDFYSCGIEGAPLRIFTHGGAWRAGDAATVAHLADTFCGAGAHFVSMDFNNIDDVGGDLAEMVRQVRSGVAYAYEHAADLGTTRDKIYISGHSSGGHLSGCILVTDWKKDFGLPEKILQGACLMSGMYDLEPVALSARSKYVNFTPETVQDLSAIRHLDKVNCPVLLGYGTQESPEFQRQTQAFADALRKAGKDVELVVADGTNHFEMLEALHNPYGVLGRPALAQMGL